MSVSQVDNQNQITITIIHNNVIADKSTLEDPHQYAVGVSSVIVNGIIVVENGMHNGNRPGKVLRGPGYNSNK